MAIASILLGIVTGVVSFAAALFAGHGLAVAFGLYIVGGMVGLLVTLTVFALRTMGRPSRRQDAVAGPINA